MAKLLSIPYKKTASGFRDYTIILTLIDTAARLSEIALLKDEDVDIENCYLRIMGKNNKE
jgi:integrase/recombinase XerD